MLKNSVLKTVAKTRHSSNILQIMALFGWMAAQEAQQGGMSCADTIKDTCCR
jgi:hypothetical protein